MKGLQKCHIHIQTDTGRKEKALWEDTYKQKGLVISRTTQVKKSKQEE
jgi:hypothetical protein